MAPSRTADDFRAMVARMLLSASRGGPVVDFLDEVTSFLLEESGASAVVVRLESWGPGIRCRAIRSAPRSFRFETDRPAPATLPGGVDAARALLCRALLEGARGTPFTARGSFWCEDALTLAPIDAGARGRADVARWAASGGFRALALVPVPAENEVVGILQFIAQRAGAFTRGDVELFEDLAGVFALALEHHRAQWALGERVKELTCLYGISRLAERHDAPLADLLPQIVEQLPPGWQYPEHCAARIVLDDVETASRGFVPARQCQRAPIVALGTTRGFVEVVYVRPMPEIDEGPFLAEERNLIHGVAAQLALMLERREAAAATARLEEQLRHADRLKTIGTLTAGVAHELNEPLGAILGFAQLAQEGPGLPPETRGDLERVVGAALRAREIIKKLMYFGRQAPQRPQDVELGSIAREAIGLVERRLEAQSIALTLDLAEPSPRAVADAGQLLQVLVNLLVNAVQAMPRGGRLTVQTFGEPADGAGRAATSCVRVADTGVGMTDDVRTQLFVPFFTTKQVGQGTGLGLSVVHGIVSAHGGTIDVTSAVGAGTAFTVRLPAPPSASPAPPAQEHDA